MTVPPKTAKHLSLAQGLTALCACGALILSTAGLAARVDTLTQQRVEARHDLCVTLRNIILVATPPGKQQSPQLIMFLRKTGLNDCDAYAHKY